jgi:hypothetical protein
MNTLLRRALLAWATKHFPIRASPVLGTDLSTLILLLPSLETTSSSCRRYDAGAR